MSDREIILLVILLPFAIWIFSGYQLRKWRHLKTFLLINLVFIASGVSVFLYGNHLWIDDDPYGLAVFTNIMVFIEAHSLIVLLFTLGYILNSKKKLSE